MVHSCKELISLVIFVSSPKQTFKIIIEDPTNPLHRYPVVPLALLTLICIIVASENSQSGVLRFMYLTKVKQEITESSQKYLALQIWGCVHHFEASVTNHSVSSKDRMLMLYLFVTTEYFLKSAPPPSRWQDSFCPLSLWGC